MEPTSSVTVFRSADSSAEEDAAEVSEILRQAGLNPAVLDDDAAGVPPGSFVVTVPPEQEIAAEAALSAARNAPQEPVDNSSAWDLVDVYEGVGYSAEMEAMGVRAVLDANQIPSLIVGTSQMPQLPFVVKVPRNHEEQAKAALAEAKNAGPAAADEAEQMTEAADS